MRLSVLYKILFSLSLIVGAQLSVWAQDRSRNFVLSRTYQVPIQQSATPVSVGEASLALDYLDGLGRPQQQIQVQAGTNGKDLITSTEYDALGRPSKTYLPAPAPSRTGAFQPNPATLATDYYNNSQVNRFADFSPRPFAETQYEASPLSRPTAVISAGTDASVQTLYGTNGDNEVIRYEAGALITEISQPASPYGYYAAKQLTTQTIIDEADKQTTDYKDKEGRLVLRRVGSAQKLDTYYVYDDLGQLRAVLQPEYQSSNNLTLHAFLYLYNGRGLLVEQRIPGGGTSTMVYDNRDRLITRTDGRGQKFYYRYDALNRLTQTGICTGSCDDTSPTSQTLLSQTFYDDYDAQLPAPLGQSLAVALPFLRDASTYSWTTDTDFVPTDPKLKRKGQSTGSCARLLSADGNYSNEWHCIANYYDDRYRLIQSVRRLPLMGNQALERVSYRYDFGGKVLSQKTQQSTNTQSYGLEYTHRYDASGRPLSIQLKTSSSDGTLNKEVVLSVPQYNEIGTQVGKALGATDGLGSGAVEQLRYRHLVRGFLQQQQASRRSFGLTYTYQTNGNVGSLAYQYPTAGSGTYSFEYDEWNRMTKGRVAGGAGEDELKYDNNGNLTGLKRFNASGTLIDELRYIYTLTDGTKLGNRLGRVEDISGSVEGFSNGSSGTGNDYSYDNAGNLLTDNNRGATLYYNCLNLLRQISFSQNSTERNLNYVYDASGQKLSVSVGGVTTYYQGSFEYDGSMSLVRLSTGEGQLVKQNNAWQWQYYLSDGQGNVRVVVQEGGSTLHENQYYPFGLSYAPSVGTGVQQGNRYQFLGKETQPQTGYVDLQARQYDPQLGRFVSIDPLADLSRRFSPYTYGNDNPTRFVDPDGLLPRTMDQTYDEWATTQNKIAEKAEQQGIGAYSSINQDGPGDKNVKERPAQTTGGIYIVNKPGMGVRKSREGNLQVVNTQPANTVSNDKFIDPMLALIDILYNLNFTGINDNPVPGYIGGSAPSFGLLGAGSGASKLGLKFTGDQATRHFAEHGSQIMRAIGKTRYNLMDYINDANYVVQHGQYVPELNGYTILIGGGGKSGAKYAFTGLTRDGLNITTFHIKPASKMAAIAPSLGIKY